jgi:hypothetical protein
MDIRIDAAATARLDDAEDFTSLRLTGIAPAADGRSTLAAAGIELADDASHAFVDPAAFARLAGAIATQPAWQDGFARMVAHASDHGWTDGAGRIRAHAEWDV